MTINAGDMNFYDAKSAKRDRVQVKARATITGGAGAVVQPLTWQEDPGITIVRGGTAGLYNITFPKSPDPAGDDAELMLISPTGAVANYYWTAFDAVAGTGQVQLLGTTGTAADPAAGNSFIVSIMLTMRKDF